MSSIWEYINFSEIGFVDLIDILILWFVIYNLLKILQSSRGMQMTIGLLALFIIRIVAGYFNMVVLTKAVGSLFNIIPIAILVLYQNEIRKFLASIGRNPFFDLSDNQAPDKLDEILPAIQEFSRNRVGALIIFERQQSLSEYAEQGTQLDALPSYQLIADIFQPKSKLHDGAVIFSGDRIAAAACVLPLSDNQGLPSHFGTRHRAAIGISEETDCVVMVVSEESGRVSFAMHGHYYKPRDHRTESLREMLFSLLQPGGMEHRGLWVKARILVRDLRTFLNERLENNRQKAAEVAAAAPAAKSNKNGRAKKRNSR